MKYFKLNRQQFDSINQINQRAKYKIIPNEYEDYWIVAFNYSLDKDYSVFKELLDSCPIVELQVEYLDESNTVIQPLIKQKNELQEDVGVLLEKKKELQDKVVYLQSLLSIKAELKNSISDLKNQRNQLGSEVKALKDEVDALISNLKNNNNKQSGK